MLNPGISSAIPVDVPLERSIYVGIIFCAILYGLNVFIFFAAVYCICHRSPDYRKRQRFYVAYGGILLMCSTVGLASDALWGQNLWIDQRNYPGGALAYLVAPQSLWYDVAGIAACVMANILGDGLLVYRCHIIWDSRWRISALPVLIYLTSSGTNVVRDVHLVERLMVEPSACFAAISIIFIIETTLLGSFVSTHGKIQLVVHFGILWVSLSVSLNVIVTFMISFRLLRMRALMREVLSPEKSSMYTNIAAIFIESAAPFSILGVCLVITVALNRPLVFAFSFIWSMFCSLSPQMIILRVAMGRGWCKETINEVNTALVFPKPPTAQEQSQGSRMTIYNSILGPRVHENNSDISIEERTSKTGAASLA